VPNIINLIDGFDGLATGIGILLACTLGVVALISQQWGIACLAFALAGALAGFLQFNFPPAKIFLGDGGAYFIGYLVATLSLVSENKASIAAALLVTFVALGLPILDTALTILRRAIQGFPVFWGDRGHIHHRLQDLGLSKHRVLLGLYAVCVVFSLLGLSIFWSQGRTLPIAFGVVVLLAILALRTVGAAGTLAELRSKLLYVLSRRKVIRYALLQGRVLELEIDRCATPQEFWRLFAQALRRSGLQVAREGVDRVQIATLEAAGHASLKVYADAELEGAGHIQRLAECFRRPFALAAEKWPEAAPRPEADFPGDHQAPDLIEASREEAAEKVR
jgi:UDP-GlcNAc:undecaprenyl-phosphate/decaprenyl-phosphate GlcNAc-1-phosphate transferase